ncbi:MAG: sulfatase-like hydrolase/transferase, partial [Oscillospiraceae bacterium]|nr:sulfatase-like hydrolase/transferase [Oscillospiraceae bacterium]
MISKPPNIVWIMSDQHSARFCGCYGHQTVKTPHIDELAQSSTLFEQAYTTCPMCIPARFAMLTGKYGNKTGTTSIQPLSHREKTAAHMLRENGYATAMIGKLHPAAPQPLGFDYYIDFPHYLDYLGPKSE